jgi:hypothetical protein
MRMRSTIAIYLAHCFTFELRTFFFVRDFVTIYLLVRNKGNKIWRIVQIHVVIVARSTIISLKLRKKLTRTIPLVIFNIYRRASDLARVTR